MTRLVLWDIDLTLIDARGFGSAFADTDAMLASLS
ncbi:hypothetical protein SAMN05216215_103510 [Saccharopolyspora shandongensis]|uniref:Uncharacterized protein n=1 Tax=Saccharopolyspora shandongensis TaxID=418495 RepID=A0A1H3MPT6_9PSEU|nr:hypothetical protein SAMN05216215_103510 [Saccharopolyspora shandongensis]